MYQPVMRLGLIGFQEEGPLRHLIEARNVACRWERAPLADADALWVNGQHAQVKGNIVRVPSGTPTRPAILLDLQEVDRPTAFTLPLVDAGLRPPETFDPTSPAGIEKVFTKFEARLRPLGAELALAHALAERRPRLGAPVYQLIHRGTMVAIVDLEGEVGVLPGTTAAQVAAAEWCARPAGAHGIPAHFARRPIPEVMWQYASRAGGNLLPERYRVRPIYFRGSPRVQQRLLRDIHMILLGQLNSAPRTFAQLHAASGLASPQVAQALAALYFAGSITTTRQNTAWRPSGATAVSAPLVSEGVPSSLLDEEVPLPVWHSLDTTVPGALDLLPHRAG